MCAIGILWLRRIGTETAWNLCLRACACTCTVCARSGADGHRPTARTTAQQNSNVHSHAVRLSRVHQSRCHYSLPSLGGDPGVQLGDFYASNFLGVSANGSPMVSMRVHSQHQLTEL